MAGALGSLVVEVAANVARFQSDMGKIAQIAENRARQVDNALGMVSNSLKALGVGLVIGLTIDKIRSQIDGAIAAAAGMQQLAERTGGTVEKLSGLADIAKLSDTSTDELASGLQKLVKAMTDAENGGKNTGAAFKAIGINAAELKDLNPDDVFEKIAKRQAEYADGTGKVAVAQALLGKSGANLLPTMKDLAEAGDLQVKVTAAQASAADEYEKSQTRLAVAQSALYKAVARELVPTFNAFTLAMLDTVKAGDGLRGTVANLAQDGSIERFARGGAQLLGVLIDVADYTGRAFKSVGTTIGYSAADAVLQVEQLIAGLRLLKGSSSLKDHLIEMNRLNVARLSIRDGFGSDLGDIFGKASFSDRLKTRLAEMDAAKTALSANPKRPGVNFNPNEGQDIKGPGDKFVEQLQKQVEQQERGRFAMLRLEAAQKGVTAAAEPYIRKLQDVEQRNQRIARIVEQTAENQAQQARFDSVNTSGNAMYLELARQAEALGMTANEQRRLTQMRALDVEVQRAMQGATAETAVQVLALADKMRNDLNAAFDTLEAKETSFSTGANRAFMTFAEAAGNSARNAENMITGALQRTEDALINFAKTGKLSFRDLFSFMAEEWLRQQIRMSLASNLKGFSLSSMFSGAGNVISSVAGFFGFGHQDGLSYVPYDGYPAVLHEGERVLTKAQASGGGSTGQVIDMSGHVYNIGQGVSRAEVVSGVRQANNELEARLMRRLRQQGVAA